MSWRASSNFIVVTMVTTKRFFIYLFFTSNKTVTKFNVLNVGTYELIQHYCLLGCQKVMTIFQNNGLMLAI